MRKYLLLIMVSIVFFIVPLQVFVIGDFSGIGIQGALYRFQVTEYGTSMILITNELVYIVNGIYSGKTALSIILWFLGTVLFTCTMAYLVIKVTEVDPAFYHQAMYGLVGSCIIYLMSCIAQYGILFHGPAGISLPVGIAGILFWTAFAQYYPKITKGLQEL